MTNQRVSRPSLMGRFGVGAGAAFVLLLFLISLWLASKRSKHKPSPKLIIPVVSKEIREIRVDHNVKTQIQPDPCPEPIVEEESLIGYHRVHVQIEKDRRISYPEKSGGYSFHCSGNQAATVVP